MPLLSGFKAAPTITFSIRGEKDVDMMLAMPVKNIKNLRPAWRMIANAWRGARLRDFRARGAETGPRWTTLSPKYAAWKKLRFPGKPILRRTDRLFSSLTSAGHPDHVFKMSNLSMEIGTEVPYAIPHQEGGENLPRRPSVRFSATERRQIVTILQKHIFKKRGGR